MRGEPGYWAVLRHADVVHVAREPNLFSASEGGVMLEDLAPEQLEMMRMMLLAMDPPRHVDYRRPVAPRFKARVIAAMEEQIREICREIMQDAAERGDVEFVHDVTSTLPSRVIGGLMGLPDEDLPMHPPHGRDEHERPGLRLRARDANAGRDRHGDVRDRVRGAAPGRGAARRPDHAAARVRLRRSADDRHRLRQLLRAARHRRERHDEDDAGLRVCSRCSSTPTSSPTLRADPGLVPGAVEEILRYQNPLHYFRRTATADTELRGVTIRAGDKVAMFYTSANRDEDVFDDPQRFDIRRNPNPHLSFGIAEHFCLGVHLARLEGRVFFEELLDDVPDDRADGRAGADSLEPQQRIEGAARSR